jgi:hypothetical protein
MNEAQRALYTQFQERVLSISLKLTIMNDAGEPGLPASGMAIQRHESLFVVSVGHALIHKGWSIETDVVLPEKHRVVHIPLPQPVVYNDQRSPDGSHCIDFAWCVIDREKFREQREQDEDLQQRSSVDLFGVYRGDFPEPIREMEYGFAVHKARYFDRNRSELDRSAYGELNMTFDGTEQRNGFYRFKLVRSHQGDEYYGGCSGAPIVGYDGKVVALLKGAPLPDSATEQREDILWGVPVGRLMHLVGQPLDPKADYVRVQGTPC